MSRVATIVIADDRPQDLEVLQILLRDLPARLEPARSGREALRLALDHDVAMFLLDVEMPGMDGLETAEILRSREKTRHVPILFLTAHDQDAERMERGFRLNAVDILPKPVHAPALRAKVQVFLDLHSLREREREANRELAERAAQAERSNADLALFAHVAAHDMQEPLTSVARYLGLIDRRFGAELSPDARGWLGEARAELSRLRTLLEDLLEYAQIPAVPRERVEVPLEEPLGTALRALRERIESTGAHVVVDRLPKVACHPQQVVRLFQNLVSNALKFRSEATPELHVSSERCGSEWRMHVEDNGIGVPAEANGRIFQLFERLHPRESHPGTGLGLPICRRIVESHGGRIWAEPRAGGGSVFTFTLPATGTTDAARA